jgi:hypothetical protein
MDREQKSMTEWKAIPEAKWTDLESILQVNNKGT